MNQAVSIGIIGDYDENSSSHKAINRALHHAADQSSVEANITWIPTPSFPAPKGRQELERFDGIWLAPGIYQNSVGALQGIRRAREVSLPFIGT